MMRTAVVVFLACTGTTNAFVITQPVAQRPARSALSSCSMQTWSDGTPVALIAKGWAKHDEVLLDATLHGWDRHDAAVFARVSAFDHQQAWDEHDEAVFGLIEKHLQAPDQKAASSSLPVFLSREPFAERWAQHDAAVFSELGNLDVAWAKHDKAVLDRTTAMLAAKPQALEVGWQKHDTAVFTTLFGDAVGTGRRALQRRRQLARTKGSLKEITTTLVRGLDSGFDEDALSYSV